MPRFWIQTVRFSFLVLALGVFGAAEPGAPAQRGDGTGGGTVYFMNGGPTNWMWSMDSDGSNVTKLGWWGYLNIPSRDLHNGYRWYLSVGSIPDEYYPDGAPRMEVFAFREDYDCSNSDTYVQLTDDATLQPFFPFYNYVQWLPGDQSISFKARRWEGSTPVEGGLYTADLVFSTEGNIIGLVALPTAPTLEFPLNGYGMPAFGTHSWDDTGTRVAYTATGLWVADLSNGTRTQIFSGEAHDPDWSPDGTKIAMACGAIIYTIRPNGKNLKSVITPTYLGSVYCTSFGRPYFSPTGDYIVCIGLAKYNGESNNEVFRATYNGRYLTNLTESLDINERPAGWR